MAVRFDEKKNLFTLQTLDSTYQMKVDDHGVLLHTYYGAPADETDFSYLIGPEDRGFSGQPGDEKKNRTYSMDYYPLEYPVQGNGDFRVKALKAGFEGRFLRWISVLFLMSWKKANTAFRAFLPFSRRRQER